MEVVYVGRRELKDGKLAHAFLLPEQIARAEEERVRFPSDTTLKLESVISLFSLKKSPSMVGGVYSVDGEVKDGRIHTIRAGTLSWLRPSHSDFVAAWKSADDDAYRAQQRKSLEKRTDADPELMLAVASIRSRYQKIMPAAKRNFQLWLLEQIERR